VLSLLVLRSSAQELLQSEKYFERLSMDSQYLATREELYHVQMDVKHVQSVQINHSDRISRLERRQADDAALKSVWGTSSPFPGILSGTPIQG